MAYYLLVKYAENFDYQYLCKCVDTVNPYEYHGSGKIWRRFLKKHKPSLGTIVIGKYDSNDDLRVAGEYYSKILNVVEDKAWANLIPEIGDGGATTTGLIRAYDPSTGKNKHFISEEAIPKGWIRGLPKWKKSREAVSRTSSFHVGRKRSTETREKMKNSIRKKRATVPCIICHQPITPQNIVRHQNCCKGL